MHQRPPPWIEKCLWRILLSTQSKAMPRQQWLLGDIPAFNLAGSLIFLRIARPSRNSNPGNPPERTPSDWLVQLAAVNAWSRENLRNMDNQIHCLIHEPTLPPCINQHKNCIGRQDRKPKTRHCTYEVQFLWQFLQVVFGSPLRSSDDLFVMAPANLTMS